MLKKGLAAKGQLTLPQQLAMVSVKASQVLEEVGSDDNADSGAASSSAGLPGAAGPPLPTGAAIPAPTNQDEDLEVPVALLPQIMRQFHCIGKRVRSRNILKIKKHQQKICSTLFGN